MGKKGEEFIRGTIRYADGYLKQLENDREKIIDKVIKELEVQEKLDSMCAGLLPREEGFVQADIDPEVEIKSRLHEIFRTQKYLDRIEQEIHTTDEYRSWRELTCQRSQYKYRVGIIGGEYRIDKLFLVDRMLGIIPQRNGTIDEVATEKSLRKVDMELDENIEVYVNGPESKDLELFAESLKDENLVSKVIFYNGEARCYTNMSKEKDKVFHESIIKYYKEKFDLVIILCPNMLSKEYPKLLYHDLSASGVKCIIVCDNSLHTIDEVIDVSGNIKMSLEDVRQKSESDRSLYRKRILRKDEIQADESEDLPNVFFMSYYQSQFEETGEQYKENSKRHYIRLIKDKEYAELFCDEVDRLKEFVKQDLVENGLKYRKIRFDCLIKDITKKMLSSHSEPTQFYNYSHFLREVLPHIEEDLKVYMTWKINRQSLLSQMRQFDGKKIALDFGEKLGSIVFERLKQVYPEEGAIPTFKDLKLIKLECDRVGCNETNKYDLDALLAVAGIMLKLHCTVVSPQDMTFDMFEFERKLNSFKDNVKNLLVENKVEDKLGFIGTVFNAIRPKIRMDPRNIKNFMLYVQDLESKIFKVAEFFSCTGQANEIRNIMCIADEIFAKFINLVNNYKQDEHEIIFENLLHVLQQLGEIEKGIREEKQFICARIPEEVSKEFLKKAYNASKELDQRDYQMLEDKFKRNVVDENVRNQVFRNAIVMTEKRICSVVNEFILKHKKHYIEQAKKVVRYFDDKDDKYYLSLDKIVDILTEFLYSIIETELKGGKTERISLEPLDDIIICRDYERDVNTGSMLYERKSENTSERTRCFQQLQMLVYLDLLPREQCSQGQDISQNQQPLPVTMPLEPQLEVKNPANQELMLTSTKAPESRNMIKSKTVVISDNPKIFMLVFCTLAIVSAIAKTSI